MQKVGKLDTRVNRQSIQPVSSSAQITEMTAVQDHTKVSRKLDKMLVAPPLIYFFGSEEMDLAVNYLDNLTRVPRFDTLIIFISYTNPITLQTDLVKIWDEVLDNEATPIEYAEKLDNLHTKYCPKR
ncbi:unnamed protein product [Prunus brigantina]